VPFNIIGQQAQKDMSPHPIIIPVPNGPNKNIQSF